jgi:hypothetical protein
VLRLAATLLHARGNVFAQEVNRNQHLDFLVLDDALEVNMHDLRLRRMTLHVLEDRGLAIFADLDVQDARVELFVLELLDHAIVIKRQCARRTAGTIACDAGGGSHPSPGPHGFPQSDRNRHS